MKRLPWVAGALGVVASIGLAGVALGIALSDDGGRGDMHDTMGGDSVMAMMNGGSSDMPMMDSAQMSAVMGGGFEAMQEYMAQHMADSKTMRPADHQQHHMSAQ